MRRRDFEQEMADELRAHVEHRADDLVASGLTRAEAVRRARVELGAVETHKESIRDERLFGRVRRVIEQTQRDLRLAWRRLARAPIFTGFSILSIGVGAGVTTAMFGVIYASFWAPTGFRDPDTLALVANQLQGAPAFERAMSKPDFVDYRRSQRSFVWVGAVTRFYQALADEAGTFLVQGEAVDGEYFGRLGVGPTLGRVLQPADDAGDAPSVAVLSHQLWRSKFAADPAIVGRHVRVGGIAVEIVGVADRDFRGAHPMQLRGTPLWISAGTLTRIGSYRSAALRDDGRDRLTEIVVGRLKPGVTVEQASAEAGSIGEGLDQPFPITRTLNVHGELERRSTPRRWLARPIDDADGNVGRAGTLSVAVMAIMALVLAVACTNLANLSLARGASREQELAVRLALGASRGRLIRELMAESLVVGLGGFALAILVCTPLMGLAATDLPMFNGMSAQADPHLTAPIVAAAAAAVALALAVCGLWPAWKLSRANVRAAIAQGGPTGTASSRTERGLIRAQVFVSVTFFSVAAIFITAISAEMRHDPGVNLEELTVGTAAFRLQTWDADRARRAVDAIASTNPAPFGFSAAAVVSTLPFGSNLQVSAHVWAPDADSSKSQQPLMAVATPGVFTALGISIIRGRAFDQRDVAGAVPVAVISEKLARAVFGTSDAIGLQLQMRGALNALDDKTVETRTVIGVSRDTDEGSLMRRNGDGLLFVPIAQRYEPPNFIVASGTGGAGALRGLAHAADPDIALDGVSSGFIMMGGIWNAARIVAAIAVALGAVTLVLTMAGLSGLLSHLVLRRTREIGIRKALGADAAAIRWMIVRDGIRPVVAGMLAGLAFGVIGGFLVRAMMPVNAAPVQPMVMLIVIIAIVPSTLVACYLPARRAMRVDPNLTLKEL